MTSLRVLDARIQNLCDRAARAGMTPWSYAAHSSRREDRELAYVWRGIYDRLYGLERLRLGASARGNFWVYRSIR